MTQKEGIEEPALDRSGINSFVKKEISEVQGSFNNNIRPGFCKFPPFAKAAENTGCLCASGTPCADVDCRVSNHEQRLRMNTQLISCPKDRLRVWFRSERRSGGRCALEEAIKVLCLQDSGRTPSIAGGSNAERESCAKVLQRG